MKRVNNDLPVMPRHPDLWTTARPLHQSSLSPNAGLVDHNDYPLPARQNHASSVTKSNDRNYHDKRAESKKIDRSTKDTVISTSVVRNITSPLSSLSNIFSSDILKYGAIGVCCMYAYKSYKDDGVNLGDGRRRNVFVWVDVMVASMMALYIMSSAFDFM